MGLLVLGFGFFGLDLIDFYTVLGVREGKVDGERVVGIDVFTFRCFAENAVTSAGEGLKGTLEFNII